MECPKIQQLIHECLVSLERPWGSGLRTTRSAQAGFRPASPNSCRRHWPPAGPRPAPGRSLPAPDRRTAIPANYKLLLERRDPRRPCGCDKARLADLPGTFVPNILTLPCRETPDRGPDQRTVPTGRHLARDPGGSAPPQGRWDPGRSRRQAMPVREARSPRRGPGRPPPGGSLSVVGRDPCTGLDRR